MTTDPIDAIRWVAATELHANHYNPNHVHHQELALLEFSLLKTGWIQPILAIPSGQIVDGFHRWTLGLNSPRVKERWAGKVPVAYLPLTEPEAMLTTIRINRAKGTHVAVKMASIVHSLVHEHSYEPAQVAQNIGASPGEVELLLQDGVFEMKGLATKPYSRSWVPRHPDDKSP